MRKRTSLKHRVHAQLLAYRHALPGVRPVRQHGHELLARLDLPTRGASTVPRSLALIEDLDEQISGIERELARSAPTTATCRC